MTTCMICSKEEARELPFIARVLRIDKDNTIYRGTISVLVLCRDCVNEYHRLAEKGIIPVTAIERHDMELEFEWTGTEESE